MKFNKCTKNGLLLGSICIMLIAAIVCTFTFNSYATSETIKSRINTDIQSITKHGIPQENLKQIDTSTSKPIYEYIFEYDNQKFVDFITVSKESNGDIVYNVKENGIENELRYSGDDVYLDGEKVIFSTESSSPEQSIIARVEGVTYTKKQPAEVKEWRAYSLNWVCSSIKLQKHISNIAVGVILSLLFRSVAGGIASAFAGDIITSIQSSDPYSTGISYKIWAANSKVTITSRYTKLKKTIYSRTDFKGDAKTVVYYSTKG